MFALDAHSASLFDDPLMLLTILEDEDDKYASKKVAIALIHS